jgi:hypothetical protein
VPGLGRILDLFHPNRLPDRIVGAQLAGVLPQVIEQAVFHLCQRRSITAISDLFYGRQMRFDAVGEQLRKESRALIGIPQDQAGFFLINGVPTREAN